MCNDYYIFDQLFYETNHVTYGKVQMAYMRSGAVINKNLIIY